MKIITLHSKVHGLKEVLIDDEDYEKVSKHTWWVSKVDKKGTVYVRGLISINKKEYLHRYIMNISDRNILVDHKDFNPLNNQKNNLRICTKRQNQNNRRKINLETSTSKYIGVHLNGGKYWQARAAGKYIGLFKTEEEAAKARDKKLIELYGDFANLNFKQ